MSFDLQLSGKRALVTGGARGVGAAVVQALVDENVRVVATALSSPSEAVENVRYLAVDLTTTEGVQDTADSVRQHETRCATRDPYLLKLW